MPATPCPPLTATERDSLQMGAPILIGMSAGVASALLLISALKGQVGLGALLYMIAPLPLFLVGLGWGYVAAVAAALSSAIAYAILGSPTLGGFMLVSQGLPVAGLCYLTGLSRPITEAGSDREADGTASVEWYPVGRLVAVAACIAAILPLVSFLLVGPSVDQQRTTLRPHVERFLNLMHQQAKDGAAKPTDEQINGVTEVMVDLLPAASAIGWLMSLLLSFWLAARITRMSGRLARPWPDLAMMRFPAIVPLALAASVVLTFASGPAGVAGRVFAAALGFSYLLLGLAVLHVITRGNAFRPALLGAAYFALILPGGLAPLAYLMLGLCDSIFKIRNRFMARPPPAPPAAPPPPNPPPGAGPWGDR